MGMKARKRRRQWVATGWVPSRESLATTIIESAKPVDWSCRSFPDWHRMYSTEKACADAENGRPIRRRITIIVEDV